MSEGGQEVRCICLGGFVVKSCISCGEVFAREIMMRVLLYISRLKVLAVRLNQLSIFRSIQLIGVKKLSNVGALDC